MATPNRPRDYVGITLLVSAVGWNYGVHRTGWAKTICLVGRNVARTDTTPGKVISGAAITGGFAWFLPHFVFGVLERTDKTPQP